MTNKTKKILKNCISKVFCLYRESRKLLMNAIYRQFTKRREINGGIGAQFKYAIITQPHPPLNQDFVLKMIKLSFSNHVRVIYDADLPSYRPAEALRKVSYLPTLSILSNWWGDFTHKIVKIPLMKTGIQPSCSNADKTWNAKYFLVKWETVLKKFRAGHKTASF